MIPLRSQKRTATDMLRVVCSCLEAINTPVSLSVYLRITNEVQELPDIHPSHYLDGYAYQMDSQALALVSKSSFFKGPETKDLKSRAVDDFLNAEKRCLATNTRIRQRRIGDDLDQLLLAVAERVTDVLGDCIPSNTWTNTKLLFGPGATSSCSWPHTTYLHKVVGKPEVTSGCIDLLHTISGEQYSFDDITVVDTNRFTTVPKSWKQLRGICIEPHLNTHFQRALGVAMVRRLSQAGIRLAEVPLENCWKLSNNPDFYATIDLKQASDSISKEVVMSTFPPIWSHWMARTRAAKTLLHPDLPPVVLEKWSSMGNGYTFEAETILFLAVCRVVVPKHEWHHVTVFGDDMMVPRAYGPEVVDKLKQLGFEVNTDKTFLDGPFKESCGFDVWASQPVRSIYIKEVPNRDDPTSFIHLVNCIRRISYRLFADRPDRSRLKHAYKDVSAWLLPDIRRMKGPDPYYWHDLLGVHQVTRRSSKIGFRYSLTDEPSREDFGVLSAHDFWTNKDLHKPFERLGADMWLHQHGSPIPKVRFTVEQSRWNPERFPSGVQMLYALSGGDSEGPVNSGHRRSFYLK